MPKAATRSGRLAGARIAASYIDRNIASQGPDAPYTAANRKAVTQFFDRLRKAHNTEPTHKFHLDA